MTSSSAVLSTDPTDPTDPTSIRTTARRVLRAVPAAAARVLLGGTFLVCGLDGFLHFIPPPSGPMSSEAMTFAGALMQTGYMFPLIKGTEVIAGALLLANRFVALGLVMLAPVIVNIFAFHAFLAPAELGVAGALVGLELYLAWTYRRVFAPMLASRASAGSR